MPTEANEPKGGFHNFLKDGPTILETKTFIVEEKPMGPEGVPLFIGGLSTAPFVIGGGVAGLLLSEALGAGDSTQWVLACVGGLGGMLLSYFERKKRFEAEQ